MASPTGDSDGAVLNLDFDRRSTRGFRGSAVKYDAGPLAYRELDDAPGFSIFDRLAGCEDANDAGRLRHERAVRRIVGGKADSACAAPTITVRNSAALTTATRTRRGPSRTRPWRRGFLFQNASAGLRLCEGAATAIHEAEAATAAQSVVSWR